MIELTVKTLDSQNHQFTVEDDVSAKEFRSESTQLVMTIYFSDNCGTV